MDQIIDIGDLKELARQRLPRMLFDYIEGGSWEESALSRNYSDLDDIELRQRIMTASYNGVSTKTQIKGLGVNAPIVLAPCGLTGLLRGNGELLAATAANDFGVPYCLSMYSIASIEALKRNHNSIWFQVYPLKDKGLMLSLLERADNANCFALVLTLDNAVLGKRKRDHRNSMRSDLKVTMRNASQLLSHPRWLWDIAKADSRTFGNLDQSVTSLRQWNKEHLSPSFSWEDIEWVRKHWKGKLIIKGINDSEDAIQIGDNHLCDVVVVSNHGGRQMDCGPSTISMLPRIVDRLSISNVAVHMDGGIRSGADIAKALCYGASAVWIGRSYLYALAAYGYGGVTAALSLLQDELQAVTLMTGNADVRELGYHCLVSRLPRHPKF